MEAVKKINSQIGYKMQPDQAQRTAQTIQKQREAQKQYEKDLHATPQLTKEDIQTIGKFSEKVESNKARGNLGELGQTIHSLVTNLFGNQAQSWSNVQIKNALDQVVEGAYNRKGKK